MIGLNEDIDWACVSGYVFLLLLLFHCFVSFFVSSFTNKRVQCRLFSRNRFSNVCGLLFEIPKWKEKKTSLRLHWNGKRSFSILITINSFESRRIFFNFFQFLIVSRNSFEFKSSHKNYKCIYMISITKQQAFNKTVEFFLNVRQSTECVRHVQ